MSPRYHSLVSEVTNVHGTDASIIVSLHNSRSILDIYK